MQEANVTSGIGRNVAMAAGIVGLSVAVVAAVSRYGAIVAVFDGAAALMIMFPAMLLGFVAKQAQKAINELDELVETGFSGREVKVVQEMIKTLDDIESDTDKIQVKVRAALFKEEKDLPPVDVMFMYRVIDSIGDLADLSQRVGSRLELMLAR